MTRGPLRDARWFAITIVVAIAVPVLETYLREMQSALLVYFLSSFWLALPRRVSFLLLVVLLSVLPLLVHAVTGTPDNWSVLATVGAVLLGTVAGTVAGTSFQALDSPADASGVVTTASAAFRGPASLRSRVILSLALSAFAALGLAPIWASLRIGGRLLGVVSVPALQVSLIAVRWAQALSLVGWVLAIPGLIALRPRPRGGSAMASAHGITASEVGRHLAVVAFVLTTHALALSALAVLAADRVLLFLGAVPSLPKLWLATAVAYAPFDLLTYIAILSLAHLSDRARQADEARRHAAALEAVAVTARLAALRARLDPHFLYNALNAAVTLARRGNGDETSRVLEELTALLRYVLDDSREWVPLHEELAFIRRYLDIMQLRFGSRLTYVIDADAVVRDTPIPLLLLQPLVENAVEHGVAQVTGPVAIRIGAHRTAMQLTLTVADDGAGPNAGPHSGSGIGLGHTRERLAMLFGDSATITLAPRAPRGAVTEVILPLSAPAVAS